MAYCHREYVRMNHGTGQRWTELDIITPVVKYLLIHHLNPIWIIRYGKQRFEVVTRACTFAAVS
jgi:hypothetical protein